MIPPHQHIATPLRLDCTQHRENDNEAHDCRRSCLQAGKLNRLQAERDVQTQRMGPSSPVVAEGPLARDVGTLWERNRQQTAHQAWPGRTFLAFQQAWRGGGCGFWIPSEPGVSPQALISGAFRTTIVRFALLSDNHMLLSVKA